MQLQRGNPRSCGCFFVLPPRSPQIRSAAAVLPARTRVRHRRDRFALVPTSIHGLHTRSSATNSNSSSSTTICCAAASSSSSGPTTATTTSDSQFRRSIWTAIDVAALLGAVGGALAALLGVVSPTYALVLPLVLPVVSLVAALQREDLTKEVGVCVHVCV